MAELPRVVWDEANLHHLLVERAERQISCEEVEDLLTDRETVQEEANEGRWLAIGRTRSGRPLAVVCIGQQEVRPYTAWQISEQRWSAAHGR
jgi:uncharacterized DUF497 family protein